MITTRHTKTNRLQLQYINVHVYFLVGKTVATLETYPSKTIRHINCPLISNKRCFNCHQYRRCLFAYQTKESTKNDISTTSKFTNYRFMSDGQKISTIKKIEIGLNLKQTSI